MRKLLPITGSARPCQVGKQIARMTRIVVFGAAILWGASALAQDEETTEETTKGQIEEIIVTASKSGDVSVQEIPMSVTAISEKFLEATGANEFEDYYRFAPGLNVQDGGPGLKTYIIRGVSLPGSIPAVGQYYDEWLTPGGAKLDPKTVDINRVEILKGPQGTLYGASAMAGIVQIISNKPDATQSEYMFETDQSRTRKGGENMALKGMLNIPLIDDKLAFRVAGYYYDIDGFIDDVISHEDNTNDEETEGLRASLLWTPTSNVTIQASGAFQNSDFGSEQKVMVNLPAAPGFDYGEFGEVFGIQDIAPTSGTGDLDDFESAKYTDDSRHDEWKGLSLRADVEAKWFDFTGIATFEEREFTQDRDCWTLAYWHGPGCVTRFKQITEATTFEVRLNSNWDKRVNWLLGAYSEVYTSGKPGSYYTNGMNANGSIFDLQRQSCVDAYEANGVAGIPETQEGTFSSACEFVMGTLSPEGAPPNLVTIAGRERLGCKPGNEKGLLATCSDFHRLQGERDREQTAFFGELRFDISDKLQAAYGVRYYTLKQEVFGDDIVFNLMGAIWPMSNTPKSSVPDEDGLIHRFDLSYHLSDDVMTFAHFSQGYRQGGENLESPWVVFPLTYETDTTDNYEIGIKTLLFNKRLLLNVTAYYIDIGNIQEGVYRCGEIVCAGYIDNVGNAESKGIELETVLRVSDGWTISASMMSGESVLAEDSQAAVGFPLVGVVPNPAAGHKGDRLPYTPKVTGSVNVTYEGDMEFAGIDLPMFANLQWFHVGESATEFNDNDAIYFVTEAYSEARLRLGVQGEKLGVTFYVNNLFDQTNDLGASASVFTTIREHTINRPRTMGVNLQVRL